MGEPIKGHGAKAISIVMTGVLAFGMMPGLAFAAPVQVANADEVTLLDDDEGLGYETDLSKSTTITVNGTEGNSYLGVPLDPITMSDSANESSDYFTKSLTRDESGYGSFDYVVEYANNTNVGTASFTIVGGADAGAAPWQQQYTGTLSGAFEIAPGDLAKAKVSLVGDKAGVFFGDGTSAVTPTVKVSLGTVLEGSAWDPQEVPAYLPESDFAVVYRDAAGNAIAEPKAPGAYTVEATPASANVKGTSVKVPFTITDQAIDLSAATFSHVETDEYYNSEVKDGIQDQVFTPAGIEPEFSVALDGVELVKGVDFEVTFTGNDKVGTATATVTGKGLYKGSASATFAIVPADISGKGEPDWSGNGCTVALGEQLGQNSAVPFTGAPHDAPVTVKFGSGYSWNSEGFTGTLVPGVDYDVTYANTTDVWLAANLYSGEDREELYPADKQPTITVTGKGNYAGTATKTFSITPCADIAKATVNNLQNPTFNGASQAIGLDAAGTAYVSLYGDFCAYGLQGGEGVLYDTTYLDAAGNAVDAADVVAAGEYTMVVTGKPTGGFTGEKRVKFAIAPADFATVEIGAIPDQVGWNAEKAPVPEMTCTFGEGDDAVVYKLTADDYEIKYVGDGLEGAGKAQARITPKGNFAGSMRAVVFNVVEASAVEPGGDEPIVGPTDGPTDGPVVVEKKANTMTAKGKTVKVKFSKAKKKAQVVKAASAFSVKKAKGAVKFAKASGSKRVTVAKNGKVTVKKGTPKGTYRIKVKVTAAGDDAYKKLTKTVTLIVKVK